LFSLSNFQNTKSNPPKDLAAKAWDVDKIV